MSLKKTPISEFFFTKKARRKLLRYVKTLSVMDKEKSRITSTLFCSY